MSKYNFDKDHEEPSIVGWINKNDEIKWEISDRLVQFIGRLPENRHYPLIAALEHGLGDDLAVLVINRDDLNRSDWHKLEDYL